MKEQKFNYSFIIPHKNCPDLLQRCVDSIPERDDVQVIVVDDNSDDDKKPALTERKGLEIVLLDASHSKGAGHARNVGLKEAKGKWLLFPDADDYYKDGFLEVIDRYTGGDNDVVYFSFEYKDGNSGEDLPITFKNYLDFFDGTVEGMDKVKFLNIPPWTKMVNSSFVRRHSIGFEEVLNGNDLFFSMRVGFHANKIDVIKEPLYVYIKNEKGLSNNKKIPTEAHLCRIKHVMQLRNFYSLIGHPEWKPSLNMRIIRSIAQGGVKVFFSLLINYPRIALSSNNLVSLVQRYK